MALVSLGLPVFNGTEEDDLELFISLYLGYLASVNVNYRDRAGNPSGAKRAMGILRSCMQGPAAIWFDRELTGKNWKIENILKNGVATLNALCVLVIPEGAGGPNAGTYVVGSVTATYAGVAGNALQTIGGAFIPSDTIPLTGRESRDISLAWRRSGGKPSNNQPNPPLNNAAGNGTPIVLDGIHLNQAFYWMRERLPATLEEKRRLRFSSIYQDNLPIQDYYEKVYRAGQMLNFTDDVINDQFFRGLSPNNAVEIERIGMEKPVDELVGILERVEKRKAEVFLGLNSRKALEEHRLNKVEPVHVPSTRQEPVEIKPVTSHAITQDMINKLLQQHTENLTRNFQSEIQTLQEKIKQLVQAQTTTNAPRVKGPQIISDSAFERVLGRINKQIEQREREKEDKKLIKAFKDLKLDDDYESTDRDIFDDPMDTSNMVRIGDTLFDDDGNECTIQLVRKKKLIPNLR